MLVVLVSDSTHAAPLSCSVKQDEMTSKSLERATSLKEIYSISKNVPGCMSGGGIAEEVSDDVVVRLSHHWNSSLNELAESATKSGLVSFVLHHIDETTDPNNLRMILKDAKSACSRGRDALCHRIETAAKEALSNQ